MGSRRYIENAIAANIFSTIFDVSAATTFPTVSVKKDAIAIAVTINKLFH